MMRLSILPFSLLFSLLFIQAGQACTTVIVSGKATRDGRPLMWKNSDGTHFDQRLIYGDHRGYPFIAISRSTATNIATADIWIGTNSEGFSIMNTVSYNISESDDMSRNGSLMRCALEVCTDVASFKHFLDTLPRPMRVQANFGVIDAHGGAAYFETNHLTYYMVDVNDPSVAPYGYLVYTNFSYNGKFDAGQGYERYQTAVDIMAKGAPAKAFTPQWIFHNLARSFYHSLLGIDLKLPQYAALTPNGWFPDSDFIPRKSTATSCVIHGVKPDENPEFATLWTILGYPPCSIAIPCWLKLKDKQSPLLMHTATSENAPICNMALALKERIFPIERGNGSKYFNFGLLYNHSNNSGYMQQLAPLEQACFQTADKLMEGWRTKEIDVKEAQSFIATISSKIEQKMQQLLDLSTQ